MITCTKLYRDIPFAHRQPKHKGHCRFIHGHNWSFEFEFGANKLDECGFVIDFGGLQFIKDYLATLFDHALVLNADDPLLKCPEFRKALEQFDCYSNVIQVPDCSSEGLATLAFETIDKAVKAKTGGRVFLRSVRVYEDSKNFAVHCA